MTPKPLEKRAPSARSGRARTSRKRRRAKAARRIAAITTIAVLALALLAVGVWMVFLRHPDLVIQNYSMEYESLIRARAAENEVPPAFAAAVILAESSYRPDAVSAANAQGLMQLLPSTAEWIAGKLGETYVEGCLFDPETNVKYGCWYLGFLLRRFGGDMRCAAAAYHAGQGTVDGWLQDPQYSADGASLDAIPYSSTDTYVKRVLKYYEKYEKLYAPAD